MSTILKFPSVHAMRAERWLGSSLAGVLDATKPFYHPIPVAGCPGRVWSHKGDLVGTLRAGQFGNFTEWAVENAVKRFKRAARSRQLNTGFASLSDLINEATTGAKQQNLTMNKVGLVATSTGNPMSLFFVGQAPTSGNAPAALAGGADCTRTTVGAMGQSDAAGSDTLHLTNFNGVASVAAQTLLLYDRIWNGAPSIAVSTAQTVTMTPARYATTGASGTSKGNFCTMEVTTVLPATAHNWTLQYVDDSGNAAENTAVQTGVGSGIASRIDLNSTGITPNQWFFPLNTGDLGISDLTQITLSATLGSGALSLTLGHPLGLFPTPGLANVGFAYDLINSAFNMQKVEVNACLSWMELNKSATTACTYLGHLTMVSG